MSAASNHEQNPLVPQWPHEQLTHLAVHTPIPATRGVESALGVLSSGTVPVSFSASTGLNFPVQQNAPFASVGYHQSELFRQLPSAFNNNNTKFDSDPLLNADAIKTELFNQEDMFNRMTAISGGNQRPHSALNTNELAAQLTGPEVQTFVHHPLLSPSARPSAIGRLNKNELNSRFEDRQRVSGSVFNTTTVVSVPTSEVGGQGRVPNDRRSNGSTLNDEDSARLLLAVSQTLSGTTSENEPSTTPPTTSGGRTNNPAKSRTFFRPPGHEAPTTPSDGNGWTCPICGFGCSSKFHYNSHMNTHGCHRCTICNYTSRTEGRLKKHVHESHTAEQRQELAAANGEISADQNRAESAEKGGQQAAAIRLPTALEHIRALADNGGALHNDETGDDSNSTGPSAADAAAQPTPVKRSGGKPKKYVCKQCQHVSTTKEDSWIHNRIHIPEDKRMCCDICPFITEYRHHLIYHLRGHNNEKPFKCSKCEYTCVNKSMLNSHMKSHTPLYQFRCQDCTYQTKYCHSLKMHTRKYNHRRVQGQVLTGSDENAESGDENMEGVETESMKNYDIPVEDSDVLELQGREQRGHFTAERTSQPPLSIAAPQPQTNDISSPGAPLRLGPGTPRLNSLLHQQLATSNNAHHLHQFLLHQQQLGRMGHESLLHGFVPRQKCDMCQFTTNTQEELIAHKINHFVHGHHHAAAQQSNLYGKPLLLQPPPAFHELAAQICNDIARRAQQAQPALPSTLPSVHFSVANTLGKSELNGHGAHEVKADSRTVETPEASGATTNTTASTPRVGVHDAYGDEHMSGSSETHEEAGDTSSSPSDSHKSMDAGSNSPHSSAHSTTVHGRAKKRKADKLDLISQRLQGKNSPDNTDDHMDQAHVDEKQDSADSSKLNGNALVQPIPLGPLPNGAPNHQLNSLLAQFSNDIESRRVTAMPYTCQHCVMAFHDQALYQIHLGFHGYELPFKCNRCGHNAQSALDFNLHLYQEKH